MRLELSPAAQRQLNKIRRNKALAVRLAEGLDQIVRDPSGGKVLDGQFAGIRSFRVGDWRILYEVYEKRLLILVIRVAHRREAYR